eukprot:1675312-Rhodomonas_salina.3
MQPADPDPVLRLWQAVSRPHPQFHPASCLPSVLPHRLYHSPPHHGAWISCLSQLLPSIWFAPVCTARARALVGLLLLLVVVVVRGERRGYVDAWQEMGCCLVDGRGRQKRWWTHSGEKEGRS